MRAGPFRYRVLVAAALASAAASAQDVVPSEVAAIPVAGAGMSGRDIAMVTPVYRPAGAGPFPVVLFSHGRAGDAAARARLSHPVPAAQVRYWLARGVAVVAPIRPGYGETGGRDAELNGARFDADGRCTTQPDYRVVADGARKAVRAALGWLHAQPWVDGRRILLEGQSVGGYATVAAAAERPAGVVGYVNFAGGTGGSPERAPGHSCDPEQLTALYSEFGKTVDMPGLWVYAENDQYWGREAPKAWYAGFAAGSGRSTFVHAPPVPDGDGHGLARHAQRLWAAYLDSFVTSIGFGAAAAGAASAPR